MATQKSNPARAFFSALEVASSRNKNLVVLGADIAIHSRTFQHFNMGSSTQDLIDTAVGHALAGKTVVVFSLAQYIVAQGWEQIRSHSAYANLNITFVGVSPGLELAPEGPPHQATEDIALMRCIPNMKIWCPADHAEVKKLAPKILEQFGPMYIRLPNVELPEVFDESTDFEIGKGVMVSDGNDIGIITNGSMLHTCMQVTKVLQKEGKLVRLIHLSFPKVIDQEIIRETAQKVKHMIVVEDHQILGGLGSAVCEVTAKRHPRYVHTFGIEDVFAEGGTSEEIYKKHRLDAAGIYERVIAL